MCFSLFAPTGKLISSQMLMLPELREDMQKAYIAKVDV